MPTEQEYINYKDFVESLDEAAPSASDKAVFNDANGPKGSLYSAIASFVLGLWASFIHGVTVVSSFISGDEFPLVNGLTAKRMSKDVLFQLSAQSNLENNFVGAFDADSHNTEETQYLKGQQVSHLGKFWQFNKNHYGAWAAADVDEIDAKQIFSADAVSTFFDDSVKTFSRTGANGFLYIPVKFYKGLKYKLKASVYSTYAMLVNDKTQAATGQLIYEGKDANRETQFVADDNYAYMRIYLATSGGTGNVEISNFTLSDYISAGVETVTEPISQSVEDVKQVSLSQVGVVVGPYHTGAFLRMCYEKGAVYRFKNTGSQTVQLYLMKSKSTSQSEIAVTLSLNFAPNAVIDYVVEETEFAYLNVYNVGASGSEAEITIEQLASNANLYKILSEHSEYILKLNDATFTTPIKVETTYHNNVLTPIFYEKGLKYRFKNTGSQPLNVYLMKSKSTSYEEVAAIISEGMPAGTSVDYEVTTTEFKYLSVYGAGSSNEGTFKLEVEQLASNANLFAKIKELAQSVASKKFSSFSIIGDSYSTYQGYIPSGYATYYQDGSGSVVLTNGVFDTWWFKLATLLKIPLFRNDSWSGSTISNTVRPGLPDSSSFVNRIDSLFSSSKVTDCKAGLILLFGGTNDSWLGNDHGQVKYSDWTSTDLEKTLPAFCYCLDKLLRWNPGSQIVFVLNSGLDAAMSDGMAAACEHYNVPLVALHDIDKSSGHPTSAGMADICEQIANVISEL